MGLRNLACVVVIVSRFALYPLATAKLFFCATSDEVAPASVADGRENNFNVF